MEYRSKFKHEMIDQFFNAVLSLDNLEECYKFFEDICTVHEIKAFAQRLEVARMLKNKSTYLEIAEKTNASTATISRVNRALLYGAEGYEVVLSKMRDL